MECPCSGYALDPQITSRNQPRRRFCRLQPPDRIHPSRCSTCAKNTGRSSSLDWIAGQSLRIHKRAPQNHICGKRPSPGHAFAPVETQARSQNLFDAKHLLEAHLNSQGITWNLQSLVGPRVPLGSATLAATTGRWPAIFFTIADVSDRLEIAPLRPWLNSCISAIGI